MHVRNPREKLRGMFYDRAARRFPLLGTESDLEQRIEFEDANQDVRDVLRIRERYVTACLQHLDAGDVYDIESDTWSPAATHQHPNAE